MRWLMNRMVAWFGLGLACFGTAAAQSARIAAADLAAARAAAVGEVVQFERLPLGPQRYAQVAMRRVELYAPDAVLWLDDGRSLTPLPRSTHLAFLADHASDPAAPRLGLLLAPDGRAVEGTLLADDGRLYHLRGTPFGGELELELSDAQTDARGASIDFACENGIGSREMRVQALTGLAAPPVLPDGPGINAASRTATVAIDSDVEFLSVKFAGNTTNANNYLAALFTGMNVIYERDLDVTLLQGNTFLRTSDSYTASATDDQLDEVGEFWAANNAGITRAFVAFLSGKSPNANSSAGIAWVIGENNMCTQRNITFPGCSDGTCTAGHYSVSQVFLFAGATASSDLLVVPHEIGHNFGANHTHCSNVATGAGPTGSATIDQCFNSESGCFSGTKVCPAPSTVNGVSNVRGTLMSYCHLSGIAGCTSSQVFATGHRTLLDSVADANVTSGCFAPVAAVNQAPVLNAINNPAAILEDAAQQTINLSGIGDGDAGATQTLTVTASSNNTALIPNPAVTYTSPNATGSVSYTPVANASGSATITVTVTDSGGTANGGINSTTRQFTVTVTAVNDAPSLNTIANPGAVLEDAGQQSVSLTGIADGDPEATQTLSIVATSSNTGLIPNPTVSYSSPNANGSLGFTPVANASGTATITVTVSDNGGTANGGVASFSRQFTVNVTPVNDAPTLNAITNPAAINEDAAEQTLSLAGIGMGNGDSGQVLTLSATSNNTALIPNPTVSYSSPNATGSISYTPLANQSGTAVITVTVTDNGGTANGGDNAISQQFTVNVVAVNDAPTLNAIPTPAAILEDDFPQIVNLSGIGAGPGDPAQQLTVTATSDNTVLLPHPSVNYSSPGSLGSITYSPNGNQSGLATVTVTVTDNGGTANGGVSSSSRQFTVNVLPVNDAPTLNVIPTPAIIPIGSGAQIIALAGISQGSGDPAQVLTVTASSNNPTLIPNPVVTYISPGATGSISYTPVAGQQGSATLSVTVTDNGGTGNGGVNSITRSFSQTVAGGGEVPIFADGFE